MQAMFAAMVLMVGVDAGVPVGQQPAVVVSQPAAGMAPTPYYYNPPRDPKESDDLVRGFFMYFGAWFQPMPQTCYTPHYGCYPGNGRDIYRPTAFHGYYYRQAYNYRPLFEYPWQAGMQEPLPFELSGDRSAVAGPMPGQPQRVEVITTPTPRPPR